MNAILLTTEELNQQIQQAVETALSKLTTKKPEVKTVLDFKEGVAYLNTIGFKCTKSLIYKLTSTNEIPCVKFGRRISFNAPDLEKWVLLQRKKTVDVGLTVAMNANQKYRRVQK